LSLGLINEPYLP